MPGGRSHRDWRDAAKLGDQLLVGVEIGKHDDLADLRVLVARGSSRCEAAPPARAAASAPADVALARIAFGQRFLFGRPAVDQAQRDVCLAFLDVDPTRESANRAAPSAEMSEQAADRRSGAAA